jgi:uncharacterized protein (TIGR02588 family)
MGRDVPSSPAAAGGPVPIGPASPAPARPQAPQAARREAEREETPLAEWITGGLGLLLALGTVGVILYEGLSVAGRPPDVGVAIDRVERIGNGWVVEFTAANEGGSTAAQVKIEGTLRRDAEEVERAEAVLDFVPAGSERKGGLFFRADPGPLTIDLRATGYAEP